MQVTISTTSEHRGDDLASLREWLVLAGDASWELVPERPQAGTLGLGTDILLAIAAFDQLADLHDRITAWFGTRHEAKDPVTLTITIDPAESRPARRDDHDPQA